MGADRSTSGLWSGFSRVGIKGSSEVSEGLTAVYHWAQNVDATSGEITGGRLSNIGLSGGFGTILLGRQTTASRTHVGFLDNASFLGASETPGRSSDTISYALSVGSVSFKADVVGNRGGGLSDTAPDTRPAADGKVMGAMDETRVEEDKSVDASQFGATLQLGENGKIALAYNDRDARMDVSDKTTHIAGHYSIGGMGFHLGYAVRDYEYGGLPATLDAENVGFAKDRKDKTVFYGVSGGLGDTGVSFFLQMRNKKASGRWVQNVGNTPTLVDIPKNSHTPYALGVSRSLGGGASVHLEHSDPDMDDTKSTSVLMLQVDF